MKHCLQSSMPHRETKGKEKTPRLMPQGSGKYSLRQPRLWAVYRRQMDHGQTPVESLDLLLDAHFSGSQQTGHPPEKESN